jgi:antitoxin component HigA of HigAB toxin-antitoxin module
MLDTMRVQEQYDIAMQQVHNLMHQEFIACGDIDEREIVCELVELYEKMYYPLGDND